MPPNNTNSLRDGGMHPHVVGVACGDRRKPLYYHIKPILGTPARSKKGVPLPQTATDVTIVTGSILRKCTDKCGSTRTNDIVSGVVCRVSTHVQSAFTPITV